MLPQRFDARRLVPVMPADVTARTCPAAEALVRACCLGAGPATRPWWQPWGLPRIEWPFGVFHVADAETARRACLQLDGTWGLVDAKDSAARYRIRLAAQRADLSWWRPLAAHDSWDAGWVTSAAALQGFRPRRATLIVVAQTAIDDAGLRVLAELEQVAWGWRRAVRLVMTGGPAPTFARHLAG
jgi:hypothetical protein